VDLGLPASTGEPPKRLVGFERVTLAPGQTKIVDVTLDPTAANHPFSYWDTGTGAWTTAPGLYKVYVGSSSRDVAQTNSVPVFG
jgi:beta-glucosidase